MPLIAPLTPGPVRCERHRCLPLGTPGVTTRGFRATEIRQLAGWIADILDDIKDEPRTEKIRKQMVELSGRFPVYQ